jgi:hypothetical protein
VEYLLLHEFHKKKYIVPDKFSNNAKETKLTKRRVTHGVDDGNFDDADINDANYHNDASESDHKKSKKAASYAGGLVLEPKKGLYDKYILLLDFNSLYPSIIQVDNFLQRNIYMLLVLATLSLSFGILSILCFASNCIIYGCLFYLQLTELHCRNIISASLLLKDLQMDLFLVCHPVKQLESCQR